MRHTRINSIRMNESTAMLMVSMTAVLLLILGGAAPELRAEEDEISFEVASIYFELNDTDGDLGIHALIDGEPWKKLEIEGPGERELLQIKVKSRLRRQGLTEIFFESAEPPFEPDEEGDDFLPPEKFFLRFPEGEYEIEGETLDGEELESIAGVTHLMPAPPEGITVSGVPAAEDCDVDPLPQVIEPVIIEWAAVTHSHPELGRTGEPIEVVKYQVVLEREEGDPLLFSVDLPPSVRRLEVPSDLTESGDELKFEILVREASGNQTAVESCFVIN